MKLDKSKGSWFKKDSFFWKDYTLTTIDNYAYQLYLNNKISNAIKQTQNYVIYSYITDNKFTRFYIKAIELLRSEKILKLKKRIDNEKKNNA